jgi:hypothetical protein
VAVEASAVEAQMASTTDMRAPRVNG